MAWAKLDDAMPHHPKVMAAGPQAFALDVAGICYSNRHGLDGFIAEASLPAVYPALSNPKKWAARLVEVERWTRIEGGWLIHDIDDYQPTAAHQKELSKKRAQAGRKGGLASGEVRSKEEPNAKQNASSKTNPVPSRPVDDVTTSSNGFAAFNAKRALEAVKERQRKGLSVKSEAGLARTIQTDSGFIEESKRIYAHKDCERCRGSGFLDEYSPGAGMRHVECAT